MYVVLYDFMKGDNWGIVFFCFCFFGGLFQVVNTTFMGHGELADMGNLLIFLLYDY